MGCAQEGPVGGALETLGGREDRLVRGSSLLCALSESGEAHANLSLHSCEGMATGMGLTTSLRAGRGTTDKAGWDSGESLLPQQGLPTSSVSSCSPKSQTAGGYSWHLVRNVT